ncbi:MAG: PEP-CTERM sorting domain-containing protein [Planctomycetota bacterium]
MQIRSAACLAVVVSAATPVAAAPTEFDFFSFSIAAGAGGVVGQLPLGPDIDFESVEVAGSGALLVDESDAIRTASAQIDYDVDISFPSGDAIALSAVFGSTIDLAFGPDDVSGSLEGFTSLDSIVIEFTLAEATFFEVTGLGGLGGDLIGLNGTADIGAVAPGEVFTLVPGIYAFERFDTVDIAEVGAEPGLGEGVFTDSVAFGLTLTTVPAPSSAALLALAGTAAMRRRRNR